MLSLKSLHNLHLAWARTLRGENADYRNLQRIEIDSFGWAEEDNLKHLQKEFNDNTFSPNQATKIYIPKPSGLLRPITILRIQDTIIYQAIANVIAERAIKYLEKYYYLTTFSNILNSTPNYTYFYQPWKNGRRKLDLARKQSFTIGNVWVGELDLTSFYDVIDHVLLYELLNKFYDDEETLRLLLSCLSQWTVHPLVLNMDMEYRKDLYLHPLLQS